MSMGQDWFTFYSPPCKRYLSKNSIVSWVSISWCFKSIPGFFFQKKNLYESVYILYLDKKVSKKKIPIIITAGRLRDGLKKD